MKTITQRITLVGLFIYGLTLVLNVSCVESQKVAMKTGTQLWTENCQRCHNTPTPTAFSAEQWETIGLHMQSRALLTENEKNKIVDFLKNTGQ